MKKLLITVTSLLVLAGCSNDIQLGGEDYEILFELSDKVVNLVYTDNNTDEDFFIYTDKKEYTNGFSGTEIYFTVVNNGDDTEADISFLFKGSENVEWIRKYSKEVEYTYKPIFEKTDIKIDCIDATSTSIDICYENIQTGTTTIKKLVDTWTDIDITDNDLLGVSKNEKEFKVKNKKKKYSSGAKEKNKARLLLKGKSSKKLGASLESDYVLYKAFIKHEINTSGEFFIEVVSEDGRYGHLDPWYDSNWTYRKKITIDSDKASSTLSDFPVYLDLSDFGSDFFSNVESDGGDIRITEGDGETELARELVDIDTVGSDGEVHFLADSIYDSSDTDFYIYYGNSSASDYSTTATYGARNVWSNYDLVTHMNDSTTSYIKNSVDDSTDAKKSATNPSESTTAKIGGYSQNFDGSDNIQPLTYVGQSPSAVSYSGWFRTTDGADTDQRAIAFTNGSSGGYQHFIIWIQRSAVNKVSTYWNFSTGVNIHDNTTAIIENTWVKLLATSEANGDVRSFYNGTRFGKTSVGTYLGSSGSPYIGSNRLGTGSYFVGQMDEIRISKQKLTDQWEETEYNNQNSPSTFYTVGSQETNGGTVERRIYIIN